MRGFKEKLIKRFEKIYSQMVLSIVCIVILFLFRFKEEKLCLWVQVWVCGCMRVCVVCVCVLCVVCLGVYGVCVCKGVGEAFKVWSPEAVSNISYPSALIKAKDLRFDLEERKKTNQ